MIKKPIPSFSVLKEFDDCPYRFFSRRAEKGGEDPRKAKASKADRRKSGPKEKGEQVHKALERRLKYGEPLPEYLKEHETTAQKVLSTRGTVFVESKLCINRSGEPTGLG